MTTSLTGWRRIASAMWSPPNDPQIYGAFDFDAGPIRDVIARARTAGHHLTPTHVVGRAVAHALFRVPELNVHIAFGRSRARSTIDVFFITAVAKGNDLSGVKIRDVAGKSVSEVAEELRERSEILKRGEDKDFARTKRLSDTLPPPLLRPLLRATAFLTETLGLDLPPLGLRREPFGSAMVTSIGMFGLPQGFAPLAWMYGVPLLVLVGELTQKAVVVDNRIEVREVLPITATIDHRYVDGAQIARAMGAFREYLNAPLEFEPPFEKIGPTERNLRLAT
jgi:pyruvate dehydrogenase E2 component (dihydrolipoamide acetyltransferase)